MKEEVLTDVTGFVKRTKIVKKHHLVITLFDEDDNIIKHQELPFDNAEKATEFFRLKSTLYEMIIGK